MDRNLFYSSYVQTYLQRDVRDLAKVGDEMAFLRFLRASAARTAQLLNIAELARDADISPNTAKSWMHNGRTAPFYFYRDSDQKEIDLLIIQDIIDEWRNGELYVNYFKT